MGLLGLVGKAVVGSAKLAGKAVAGSAKLAGKAVVGGAKLAGKGVKSVGSELGKEAKSFGKELAEGAKNKMHKIAEEKAKEIREDLFDEDDDVDIVPKKKVSAKQNTVALIESKKVEEKKKLEISYEEQIHALKEMGELLKEGLITQQEFDMKKKQLLGL